MNARDREAFSRLRAICIGLPEAVEKISHGEPTWRAGEKGKLYAMLDNHHHGAPHFSVWLPAAPGVQQGLIESHPKRFFRPPYVGPAGWVGVVLDASPDWNMVGWLIEQAYRQVAHPRLVAALGAPGATRPAAPPPGRRASRAARGRSSRPSRPRAK